jgi:hypothetical protein
MAFWDWIEKIAKKQWLAGKDTMPVDVESALPAGTNIIGKTVPVDADGDEKFTDANPANMKLTGRKLVVATGTYDQALNVSASGGTATITITPPAGELWRVKGLYINLAPPSGATSGTHEIRVYQLSETVLFYLYAASNYGDQIRIRGGYIDVATATNGKLPTTEQAQQNAILNLVATNDVPLGIFYKNSTDVAQTNTLNIFVAREVEYIVG